MNAVLTSVWKKLDALVHRMNPLQLVVLGYASYIIIGAVLLWLPIAQQTRGVGWLDHLFMATSAVSTTGLTTVSTADTYNFFGELIVLILIQLGGLGYMTLGSFAVLAVSGQLSPFRQRISTSALCLPDGFEVRSFLRVIIGFTLVIELVGAALLYPVFRAHEAPAPVWQAIFHSVSAFCTAGFGLFNDSFESYRGDRQLNYVIMALSYLGALGFIVVADVWRSVRHFKLNITMTSRVIVLSTIWISLVGTVLFALDETSVRGLPLGERWLTSWFQIMTASTTVGFNTIPMGALSASSLLLLLMVMMIGASPSGTGGGIKTTTVTALWAEMLAALRNRQVTTFLGREIPRHRLRASTANLLFYCLTLAAGIYALALVETFPLPDLMFESASALGTVGLSRGITGSLTPLGKGIIILLMFLGRIGPIALGMALLRREQCIVTAPESKAEDIAV
jgi:trk system potassium uptake protein TrkH